MTQNTISPVIGLITMGTSASVETYFHRHIPPHVEVATTRVAFEEVSYLGLLSMVAQLPAAARLLLSARPRVFAIPSMTGSCIMKSSTSSSSIPGFPQSCLLWNS